MPFNFENRQVLVTGATRGIGRAIADEFIKAGAQVILTGTKHSRIKQLVEETHNPNINWIHADFSSSMGIDSFLKQFGMLDKIDVCVNNAGINIIKPFQNYSKDEYSKLMEINLSAPFRISQYLVGGMKERKFGRIINISSIWSLVAKSHRSLYSQAKTGLLGLTRSLATELAEDNVLVNSVSPGFTLTELTKQSLSTSEMEKLCSQIPLGRFADPEEIAKIVAFLASDLNTYLTGQNIVVDGGFTIV